MAGYPADGEAPADRAPGRWSRRRLLAALGVAGAAGAAGAWALIRPEGGEPAVDLISEGGVGGAEGPHGLDDFVDNVRGGGPAQDGIPSIDAPAYVAAGQADFLRDDDVVFGAVIDGQPRAYPQLVLVWHEILNDTSGDGPVCVTYCPLTGTAIGFRPPAGIAQFGTTGKLVNSNLLMYDRTDQSRWPQILGQAIDGPRRGEALEEFGLEWTTWRRWRDAFPETEVLSAETGYVRRYGEDPYGSYNPVEGYYAPGTPNLFPLMTRDYRHDRKSVFVGAKLADARLAVGKDLAVARQVVTAELDGTPVVFLHDPDLATVRAFRAEAGGDRVALEPAGTPGQYAGGGAVWDSWGNPVTGAADPLERIVSYDVMWFAWAAFFPKTEVIA
jgi:hypothetical protein